METKRWKFCPECGGKLEESWKHCAECGLEIGAVIVIIANPQPQPFVYPIYPIYPQPYYPPPVPWQIPWWGQITVGDSVPITTTTGPLPNIRGSLVT